MVMFPLVYMLLMAADKSNIVDDIMLSEEIK